ncbi:GNAT family N-acetyltransferase [Streptomyces sp. SL13]|uniref:GNAT family N-acetyltransferase n=1 Tax=Streptantibioticus silvisoli TaxID=2705255 RepID=A0AA90HAE2_9ACTN|nr:GNAT family N-acetyltransferase [Streptantibioticus silvisoli]MDI5966091.1 GNAT family N-acetyltransferase [Streptantibioticus silvisoli]MDI5971945.1 GNAT family N-acetyltransferase [Streptantibioticus silvisoli]
MTFAIAPMSAEHIPESAALLDRWYARTRRRPFAGVGTSGSTASSAGYDSEERLAKLLAEPGAEAVVARGSRAKAAGYLVAGPSGDLGDDRPDDHGGPRAALVAHGGHAPAPGIETEALRELYAAVSERLVARGRTVHHVELPADDAVAMAWFRLGFGLEAVRGVIPVKGSGRQPRGVEGLSIRRAGPADLAPVGRMAAESSAYRRKAAMFQPQPEEVLARQRVRYADALGDPACGAWLAMRRGEEAGMVVVTPARPGPFTPQDTAELAEAYVEPTARGEGVSRVLLATAQAWAFGHGYRQLTASWPTASPLAAGHWPTLGFTPVTYRLCRVIDTTGGYSH